MKKVHERKSPKTRVEVEERLREIRAQRGYLLPHHGLMAVAAPNLLEAYNETYINLAFGNENIGPAAREFVWLIIEAIARDAIATHHIARWRDAGGTDTDLEIAIKLAAFAEGAGVFSFVSEHWQAHLPDYEKETVYRSGLAKIVGNSNIPAGWVEIALAAAHACKRQWWAFQIHVRGAYETDVSEGELADALSLTTFPSGVANFVEACELWRQLILSGAVKATEPYRAWAEMSGQGGFDGAKKP